LHGRRLRRRPLVSRHRRKIEWSASRSSTRCTHGRSIVPSRLGSGDDGLITERARRSRRIGVLRRVENIGTASGRTAGNRARAIAWRHGHRRRLRRSNTALRPQLLETIFGVVLNPLELHFKLLVAILKLLEGAGQLPQRIFHAVKAHRNIALIGLRNAA